jgi:sec-independent protein translocase protein TatB
MFDIGFSELMVIALVALIVIGPERLPKVARTAGHLLGRLQRYVNDIKADINREMQLEELRKLQQQMEQSAREVETSIHKEVTSVEESLNKAAAKLAAEPAPLGADAASSSPAPEAAPSLLADSPQMELGLASGPPADKAG